MSESPQPAYLAEVVALRSENFTLTEENKRLKAELADCQRGRVHRPTDEPVLQWEPEVNE